MNKAELTRREQYVQQRYVRWRTMTIPFAYKERKGERLTEIIRATGGLPPQVFELGVGPGAVAKAVSDAGARVVGMDLSLEALQRAQVHCRESRVRLLRGSGFSLPLTSGALPLVYASQVLHLFDADGRLALMNEVKRVLAPGGRFLFDMKNVASHPWRFFSSQPRKRARNFPSHRELCDLLTRAGFARIEVRAGLFPGLGAAIGSDAGPLTALAHTRFYVAWV